MIARSFVGVGEAAYATIAPALLSDYYPAARRNRILSFFYIAIPFGAALGYGIGGVVGGYAGWRVAFLVCGIPGIGLALLCLLINEPPRGLQDKQDKDNDKEATWMETLTFLPRNGHYMYTLGGTTMITFASGGMADWFPTWLQEVHNQSITDAGLIVGAVTVIGGLGGTVLGAYWGEWARKRTKNPFLCVSGLAMIFGTFFTIITIILPSNANIGLISVLLIIVQVFLWVYIGPTNALTANCVPARMRTRAFGVSILVQHALGDAISPPIIGALDSAYNLAAAVWIIPVTFAVGTVIWIVGWLVLEPLPLEKTPLMDNAGSPLHKPEDPLTIANSTPAQPIKPDDENGHEKVEMPANAIGNGNHVVDVTKTDSDSPEPVPT